jgi:hypothetical protein
MVIFSITEEWIIKKIFIAAYNVVLANRGGLLLRETTDCQMKRREKAIINCPA